MISRNLKLYFAFILSLVFSFVFFSWAEGSEVRAIWVRPLVNADLQIRSDAGRGREFIRRELLKIKQAGLNTIYLESFWSGYTIYPTRVTRQRPLSINSGVADQQGKGWDVLQTYLDEAAKLNLKIHAWMHVFYQWNSNLGGLDKSPIFSRFPEWAMIDSGGSDFVTTEPEGVNRDIYKVFLSPSNRSSGAFLLKIVSELAQNYPRLKGIQWDYIRYPLHTSETSFDYNPQTLKQFQRDTGLNASRLSARETPREWKIWRDWKTRQVTALVKNLSQIIRKKRPGWEISAAVYPGFEENLRTKMQNPQEWAQKRYLDVLLPMLYSADFNQVETWAKEFRARIPAKIKIYPAILVGNFYQAGGEIFDTRYLDLGDKFKFEGLALFAGQSLTDELVRKLAGINF